MESAIGVGMPLDNQNELFYWVDENDNVLGSITRSEAHSGTNKIHRAVSILVVNRQKQMLLQKRSQNKDMIPGFWAEAVGGHVTFGDDYDATAKRELAEELGIRAQVEFVGKGLFDLIGEREFFHIYTCEINFTPKNFARDEIDELKWVGIKNLPKFMAENKVSTGLKKSLEILRIL